MNGQAKIDFEKWLKNKDPFLFDDELFGIFNLHPLLVDALIIEFFDNVGIIIKNEYKHRDGFDFSISYRSKNFNPYSLFKGNLKCVWHRKLATEKAIEKAVEIYNNLK